MFEGSPETVRIDITGRCNRRCLHCQASMFLGQRRHELATSEWIRVIDELAGEGCIDLGILGGEPLLRKDIVEIVSHARKRGLRCLITTNGDLLHRDLAKRLLVGEQCSVSVSFDGPTRETHDAIRGRGSFDKSIRAMSTLSDIKARHGGAKIGLSFVVHAGNIDICDDFVDLALSFQPDYVSIAEVHDGGRAQDNWAGLTIGKRKLMDASVRLATRIVARDAVKTFRMDFFTSMLRRWLLDIHDIDYPQVVRLDPSGIREAYIQHDGRMFPSQQCSDMRPELLRGAAARGVIFADNDLRSRSVAEVWRSAPFQRYREIVISKAHVASYEPCSTCHFSRNLCQPSIGPFLRGETIPQMLCALSERDLASRQAAIA